MSDRQVGLVSVNKLNSTSNSIYNTPRSDHSTPVRPNPARMSSSLSPDQREILANFQAITQAGTDTAIEVLESSRWNLEVSNQIQDGVVV